MTLVKLLISFSSMCLFYLHVKSVLLSSDETFSAVAFRKPKVPLLIPFGKHKRVVNVIVSTGEDDMTEMLRTCLNLTKTKCVTTIKYHSMHCFFFEQSHQH